MNQSRLLAWMLSCHVHDRRWLNTLSQTLEEYLIAAVNGSDIPNTDIDLPEGRAETGRYCSLDIC
jgi:hypothetical protein